MVYAFKFSQIKDLLLFYQTLIITKRHHQIINEKNIPDWMSVIIFIDKVIDYQDFEFKKGDAKSFLKGIIEKKMDPKFLSSYSFQKIKNLLVDHWEIDIGKEPIS